MKLSFRRPLDFVRSVWSRPWRRSARSLRPEQVRATQNVNATLARLLPRFESICVVVGEKTELLQSGSASLVKDCETLLHIASGRDGGDSLAQETLAILRDPLAYLDFCQQQQTALIQVIGRCEQQTFAMLAVRSRMETTLAPLTYLTTLFKIESARLDEDLRDTFVTVTTEVDRMRQLVNDTFNKNAELLANAHSTLASVRQNIEREFKENLAHVTERRRQIDEAIATLDRQLAENSRRDIQLHTHSRGIATEVSQIVHGLQFQDIVQQKCDHILSALAAWDAQPPAAAAIRLQALQLEGAASDLASGHGTISGGIERIGSHVDKLDRSSQHLEEFQGMVAASDGMVQRLLDAISEVHEMIRAMATLTERTHESVRPAAELAGSLTSTLVELATNMRLIALNAQIRSVQIGAGTGLEQLASRTAEISREINAVSEETAADLGSLRQGITEMLSTFEEFRRRGDEQLGQLAQNRVGAEANLHALRDRAMDSVRHIGETAKQLHQSADALLSSIAPIPDLRDDLLGAGASLHSLVRDDDFSTSSDADLAAESARYTMASERSTHGRVTGVVTAAVATGETEFFAPSPPAPVAAAPRPPSEAHRAAPTIPAARAAPSAAPDSSHIEFF